jgi:hypothetical protein
LGAEPMDKRDKSGEKNRLCAISLEQMPASVPIGRVYAHLVSVGY